MTTTVSFATRNCVVIGCDSLATSTVPMVNPHKLLDKFFNPNDLSLKVDEDGNPLLNKFNDLGSIIENLPYNQLPNVTKIYSLGDTSIGVLFAGIAVINDRSIKNIIDDFLDDEKVSKYLKESSYTVKGVSDRLKDFIQVQYDSEYKDSD